jgi:hypothetical protein
MKPQMARITCNHCGAWYGSDRELRDHVQTAHRGFGFNERAVSSSDQADPSKQGCGTSFLMEERNEMDKLCERTPAEKREEYTQPDREKELGGES